MRGNVRRRLAGLLVGVLTTSLLTISPPVRAAADPAIQGNITDLDTGQPVAGACVALLNTPLAVDHETCTDDLGRFTFNAPLTHSTYRMRVRAPGYAERWYWRYVDFAHSIAVGWNPISNPTEANMSITRYAGNVQGRVTRQDGSPAAGVAITATPNGQWNTNFHTTTSASGEYRLDGLPQGDYRFSANGDGYGQSFPSGGSYLHVATGATVVQDMQFRPVDPMPVARRGTLTGTVRSSTTGAGIGGVCLTAYNWHWFPMANSCADAGGRYEMSLPPETTGYRVRLQQDGVPDLWAPSGTTHQSGAQYPLAHGTTTTADLLVGEGAYGSVLQGRIVDHTGVPPTDPVTVTATAVPAGWSVRATVAADGAYRLPRVPPGDYRLSATASRIDTVSADRTPVTQWFPQRRTAAEGDVVTVRDQEVLTRDETLIAPAELEITLLDEATDQPVASACVGVSRGRLCAAADGVYRFPRVWTTSTYASVAAEPYHYNQTIPSIPMAPGETVRRTVRLKPGAVIRTQMWTPAGQPMAGACIYPVPVDPTADLGLDNNRFCADRDGYIAAGPLPAGAVNLFARSGSLAYGAKWVGWNGGTGDRREATSFNLVPGLVTNAPVVRFDPAGTIRGTITDRETGLPVAGCVRAAGDHPEFSGPQACAAADGTYELAGLGPYRWPLRFSVPTGGYAATWSGPATDRHSATMIQVTADSTTRYDMALGPEGRIPLSVTNAPAQWTAQAYHPATGDLLATAAPGQPHLGGLNTGPVYIRYTTGTNSCWYIHTIATGPLRRLVRSYTVQVTAGQTTTPVTITPGSTCITTAPRFGIVAAGPGTPTTSTTDRTGMPTAPDRRQPSRLAR